MSDDEHDEPSNGFGAEERTNPGIGPEDAFASIAHSARRALAALGSLESTCPPIGAAGRRRHLEVIAHRWGELGGLAHDTRHLTLALIREEENDT